LKKFKANIGLDQALIFTYGAAPLKPITVDFFAALDVPLFNLWGLTETTGGIVGHELHKYDLGASGRAVKYVEIIAD